MSSIRSHVPKAPAIRHAEALLLCAHGVSGGPGVAERHAEAIRSAGPFAEVSACCLHGNPSLEECLLQIAAPHIRLMPLLMAEGLSHAKMADSAESLRLQTAGLAARGGFAEVRHALIEADPLPHAVLSAFSASRLIAVGFFLDGGIHGETDVPACLSDFTGEAVYTGPIGNDPGIPRIILDLLETRSRAVA